MPQKKKFVHIKFLYNLQWRLVLIVFVKVAHYSGVWYLVFAKMIQMRIVELWHQVDFYCSEPAV